VHARRLCLAALTVRTAQVSVKEQPTNWPETLAAATAHKPRAHCKAGTPFAAVSRTCGGHTNSGSFLRAWSAAMAKRGGEGASRRKRCFTPSGILAGRRVSVFIVTHVLHSATAQQLVKGRVQGSSTCQPPLRTLTRAAGPVPTISLGCWLQQAQASSRDSASLTQPTYLVAAPR
jgi:hypothetical protein